MRRWFCACAFVVCLSFLPHSPNSAAWPPDDDDNKPAPQPGLVVTYRDNSQPTAGSFTTTEGAVALFLKADESPHPRLAADGFTARWQGQIRILRPESYRFSAWLRGNLRVTVNGKEVLKADVADKEAAWRQGPPTELKAGTFPFVAEFTKHPGMARVQLFWEAKYFHVEPVPHDFLKHLPTEEPAELATDQLAEKGQLLAEKHSCTACHQPKADDAFAKSLQNRLGPDLSQAGKRLRPEWLVSSVHMMPSHDEKETSDDIVAVRSYLASLGGPVNDPPVKQNANELAASVKRGIKIYQTVGCAACHGSQASASEKTLAGTLWYIRSKTTIPELSKYLQNPSAIDPHSPMPSFNLNGNEATDLARALFAGFGAMTDEEREQRRQAIRQMFQAGNGSRGISSNPEVIALGKRLVRKMQCVNCHKFPANGPAASPDWSKHNFTEVQNAIANGAACNLTLRNQPGVPRFNFSDIEQKALRAFCSSTASRYSQSPVFISRLTLQRLNCLACHSREGQGGLTTEMTDTLRKFENAENAEAVSPPPLTGIGTKLNTAWMRQVLTQGGRARPWMGLRMPQFGDAHVGHLPEELAALDGVDPSVKDEPPAFNTAYVEAGRHLVGKKAFGCIACHDIAGVAASGTRGPDLALMQQRVRYSWYRRWMEQPQRMQPGTRMPTVFAEGRTLLDDVLGGRADAQADAVWVYLSIGSNLPLPEGLEPPKGLALTVKDRPIILRTFMPDAGSRAIAVGYPNNVSVAFDSATCRLAYAWGGNFLDASPVWNDRGGNPAKILGPRFWESPRGFPWAFTANGATPDFAAQARDPALAAPLPEGQLYTGPKRLFFAGYQTDPSGNPIFRYRVALAESASAEVREQITPLRRSAAVGFARRFTVSQPAGIAPWLLAGEATAEPHVFDASGNEVRIDWKSGDANTAAAGRSIVFGQGDRVTVLQAASAPQSANWHFHRQGNGWQILLHWAEQPQTSESAVVLQIWQPYRNEPGVIRELLTTTKGSQ